MQSLRRTAVPLFFSSSVVFAVDDYKRSLLAKNSTNANREKDRNQSSVLKLNINKAVTFSSDLVEKCKTQNKIPGIVVGVSFKGTNLWIRAFGFSDIELGTKCNESTVMRIASVSKCLSMLAVGKLVDERKLNFDDSIYKYLNGVFPEKKWEGKSVDITIRQVASHLSGIRDYSNSNQKDSREKGDKEFLNKERFETVFESLKIFKDDELISKPGSQYNYTTHGFTLLSAAAQQVLPKNARFEDYLINKVCRADLGMNATYLDKCEEIINNKSKLYQLNGTGKLMNAPYIDNSYSWAGAGILSNVPDLLKFANVLIYSYNEGLNGTRGYLKKSTVEALWTPSPQSVSGEFSYGLGFGITKNVKQKYASCYSPLFKEMIWHGGATIGGSSYILILPEYEMAVVAICNLGHCFDLEDLVFAVATQFVENIFGSKTKIFSIEE